MSVHPVNDLLTRTGPGTPMGNLLRQYWLPAAMSQELAVDAPPMRLMLLGEKLIAFRDSAGKVGVMDHRCPHRLASLFFGRNEQGGIRCVYHGWKFDTEGKCLDMLNLRSDSELRQKVKARAYRTLEHNGIVYVYMGAGDPPPLPQMEPLLCPQEDVTIRFTQRECNWLQAVEGELDTSHVGILHFGAVGANAFASDAEEKYTVTNRAPDYVLHETKYGQAYAAHRPAEEGRTSWRVAHLLLPFWCMPPISALATNVLVRGYIPMDDTHTMIVAIEKKGARDGRGNREIAGVSQHFPYLPNTTDWLGRWRLKANMSNDFEIDRELQRTSSFTGIEGVQLQDHAIQVSMGEIADRSLEFLAPSDVMVVRIRRVLQRAVEALQNGEVPESARHAELYANVRGGHFVAPSGQNWLDAYAGQLAAAPSGGAGTPTG
jgi:phthalate 4,5-dioxygenase oxygenase subunit